MMGTKTLMRTQTSLCITDTTPVHKLDPQPAPADTVEPPTMRPESGELQWFSLLKYMPRRALTWFSTPYPAGAAGTLMLKPWRLQCG